MSKIILEHPAVIAYYDIVKSIYETMHNSDIKQKTLSNWINLVEHHCQSIGKDLIATDKSNDIKSIIEDEKNKFRGDMFEIFSELFFKISPADNRFGLTDYKISNSDEDYGVDATGINFQGNPTVVQCKYRVNFVSEGSMITYEDIAKTYADGRILKQFELSQPYTICLITTSKSVSYHIGKVFGNLFLEINGKNLEACVNGMQNFWSIAHQLVIEVMDN